MRQITRHIWLERRRLTLIGVLSFAAGFTLYSHIDVTRMGLPVPFVTGFIYMAAVVLAAAVTTYFLPGLRRVTDAVAFTRLGFALWVASTQSYEIASSPFVSATVVIGGAILLLQIGGWLQGAAQRVQMPQGSPDVLGNVRAFVIWLDNTAGYHAEHLKPAFGSDPHPVHA